MRIAYLHKNFGQATLAIIQQANDICTEYQAQGFDLTLRQLYYQFVSRGLIANKMTEYKRLGGIINDARLAGLLDWDHIVDRTRNLESLPTWGSPSSIIASCADQFRTDRWKHQEHRIEVWIEKEALAGIIEGVCNELHVPFFACKGYTSQSEAWAAGQRLQEYIDGGQDPIILHLGDHDPSGIDMTRDIEERLFMFTGYHVEIKRLALNWNQVQQYNPPPNPAKLTDSRVGPYLRKFGDESWELDALEPRVIADLIRQAVMRYRDEAEWDHATEEDDEARATLRLIQRRWTEVQEFLKGAK